MTKSNLKRAVAFFVLILTIFVSSISSYTAYAHDAYFLQVLIDLNTMQYQGNVVSDKASLFNKEAKHIEATLGDFSLIRDWKGKTNVNRYEDIDEDGKGDKAMVFTFPSHEVKKGLIKKEITNNATQKDVQRAYEIRDTLVPGLNDAIYVVTGGKPTELTVDEFISLTEKIANGTSYNGWSFSYSENDMVTISKGTEKYEFVYRMKKGYNDSNDMLYNPEIKGDNTYVSWQQLIFQGNYTYTIKGHTAMNAGDYNKPGVMEQKLVEVFEDLLNGLRNLLGLYNTNDLIYNQGIRGSMGWYMGAMSNDWMSKTISFHFIFQGIAWTIIALAVVKNLLQRNIATINPSARVSLIEAIKDLFVTAFILASIFQIINTLLFLNTKVINIFATTSVDFTGMSAVNNYSNALSGIVLQFFYFVVSIYLNFVYIIRAITLAILIATAPLFVVSIAFGGKWKQLFNTWLRELVSNIFLQSFHAFILAFFVSVQTSSRGIEGMVVAFALIPMTEFFRTMFMGQGGEMSNALGMASVTAGASMLVGSSRLAGGFGKGKGDNGNSFANSSGGMNTGAGKSTQIPGTNTNPNRREHSATTPDISSTRKTFESKEQNLKGSEDVISVGKQNSKGYETLQNIAKAGASATKAVAKTGVGAGKVAVGAGTLLAMGGSSSFLQQTGSNMMGSGLGSVASGVGGLASDVGGATKNIIGNAPNNLKAKTKTALGMNSVLGAQTMPNGDIAVHRDRGMLSQQGVSNAYMDSQGNAVISYNRSKLDSANLSNVNKIEDAYKKGNTEWLKEQGIERVSKNNNGELMIAYNKQGQEKLGFNDIYMTGNRVVETKRSDQNMATNISFDIGSKSVTPQPPKKSSIIGVDGQFLSMSPSRKNTTKTNLDDRPY